MILKFYSKKIGCWVLEDGIEQVKLGYCRFVKPEDIDMTQEVLDSTVKVESEDKTILIALRCGAEECHDKTCARMDWDWIVDKIHAQGPSDPGHFKWVRAEYQQGRGAPSDKTFIFDMGTRVYVLNDEGKTIERL